MIVKPKHLIDLKKITSSVFSKKELRLDLRETKLIKIPIFKLFKIGALFVVCSYLVFGSALAPIDRGQLSMAAQNDEQRKQLEAELESSYEEIAQIQATIEQYRGQGKNLESEVKRLNAQIAKLNLQVKATNLSLKKLDDEIETNSGEIKRTETDIEKNKRVLVYALQNLYSSGSTSLVEVFLKNFEISDFFDNIKNLTDIQDDLRITLEKVMGLKQDLIEQNEQLIMRKKDANSLKAYQLSQQKAVASTKTEKSNLLQVTKGQESKYQDLLKETQIKAAQIRSQIFKLLGGGELTFGEAVKIGQLAEKATGVRAAFVLSILTQESGVNSVIGANLGKCYYNTPNNCISGKTVMKDAQKGPYLALVSSLDISADSTPVSCAICRDGNYGGAMGPAQFMPATWALYTGYSESPKGSGIWVRDASRDKVAAITGNNPSSPFNNADAFTATALLLKDNIVGCRTIYKTIFSQESCAAAKYYAGGNWRSYMSVGRYGYRVAERATEFAEEIEILDSN